MKPVWRERYYQVGGCRVFACQAPEEGPPVRGSVVLVHGLGVSGRYLLPLGEELVKSGFRVHIPDLPGFGRSQRPHRAYGVAELADALLGYLDAASIQRAAMFGNSMGCQILAEFLLRCPERASAVVLQGPTMDRHARTAHQQFGRLVLDSLREPPSQVLLVTRDYLWYGPGRFLRTFFYALNDPIESKLPQLDLPALVVRGDRDPIVTQRWAEEVAAALPHGRLVVIPGPHTLNYTCPAELAAVVVEFLAEGESGNAAAK